MKQVALGIALVLALVGVANAGPKAETYDVTTFTPPSGWSRTTTDTSIELTIINQDAGAAASIRISSSTTGAAVPRENFDRVWPQIVTIPDVPAPKMAPATKRDGWDVVKGTSKYTFSGRDAKTTIVAATRDSTYALIVATTVGPTYVKDVEKVLASVRYAAPPAAAPAPQPAAAETSSTLEVKGAWGYSTGGAMGYGTVGGWLRESREYVFDGKGNYTFLRRYDVDQESETTLVRERGKYTLTSDSLTVTPTKSEREVWSKKPGSPEKNPYEKLVRREKIALEKTTYRVGWEPDEDKGIVNLVLTPPAQTTREGIFNASGRYRWFRPDGKYYTPIHPTP